MRVLPSWRSFYVLLDYESINIHSNQVAAGIYSVSQATNFIVCQCYDGVMCCQLDMICILCLLDDACNTTALVRRAGSDGFATGASR